eukprot:8129403-Alexandrium_andersonii.AAC.1
MLIGSGQPHLQGAREVAETAGEIRGPRQTAITNPVCPLSRFAGAGQLRAGGIGHQPRSAHAPR